MIWNCCASGSELDRDTRDILLFLTRSSPASRPPVNPSYLVLLDRNLMCLFLVPKVDDTHNPPTSRVVTDCDYLKQKR